ncbi:hypothetical protein BH23PLA1_BH23PLA1_41250 [soil metagenome]
MFIILSLEKTILLRRDHRCGPARFDRRNEIIAVISLIRNHGFRILSFDQGLTLIDVGFLSPRQDQLDGVAEAIDGDVQLGPEPAPRPSQRLVGAPFFAAPAACW